MLLTKRCNIVLVVGGDTPGPAGCRAPEGARDHPPRHGPCRRLTLKAFQASEAVCRKGSLRVALAFLTNGGNTPLPFLRLASAFPR